MSLAKNKEPEAGGVELKEELKQMAMQGGALVFGVADATAFGAAPEGYRPVDILPGAKSVVALGGAKPRAGDWQSPNYQHLELSSTNDRITGLCLRLAHTIERQAGHYAVVVPAGVDEGQRPFLSIRRSPCGAPGPSAQRDRAGKSTSAVPRRAAARAPPGAAKCRRRAAMRRRDR